MKDYSVLDCGQFNMAMLGYVDIACRYAGITEADAEQVHLKMILALDMYSAEEAERMYLRGIPERM